MSFNLALAKEIYGVPWCMDAVSFQSLSAILNNNKNGVTLEIPEIKYNSPYLLNVKSDTRIITRPFGNEWNPGQLENGDKFEGIGVINLDGAITLSGGASSLGMEQLSERMYAMAKDERIVGFVIRTNSGGGASGAVKTMSDTINEIKKTKPVYASIKKGGMAGSAAYGIISPCTKIFSEDGMNIVGSVGTMIQFSGKPHGNIDQDGEKTVVLYATKSVKKNKSFEEAINNDNYDLLINELLDPINEAFIESTLSNRPQLAGSNYDDGHTVFSKDAIGTFIDGIASFDEVVNMVVSEAITGVNKNQNNNSNSNTMNKAEIKQNHPEVYNEILNEGVSQEQERRAGWNAFKEIDSKAVEEGIESGLPIKQSEVNSFIVKATQVGKVEALKSDSAPGFTTKETSTEGNSELSVDQKEAAEAFKFDI